MLNALMPKHDFSMAANDTDLTSDRKNTCTGQPNEAPHPTAEVQLIWPLFYIGKINICFTKI